MTGTVNELPDAKPAPAPAPKQADQATVEQAAKAFAEAKRPLVVIGNGAVGAGAEQEVNTLVHTFQLPFATTLLGIAVVPSEDEFFLGMGGMHGSYAANQALEEAMEAMLALGYKATELKKIKKFFEGTSDTAENYIKSALKMLVK